MIHVCYMTNNGYCAPTVVSAVSVFESNRDVPVCVHVLTEEVSPENERLLMSAAENYPNGTVRLHNCDTYIREIRENYRPTGWKGTCNAYLYMFMEELFPDLDRILWIDGDTVNLQPLKELWETDLTGKVLGGILDIPAFLAVAPDDPFWDTPFYFNGGVLLFNLQECRKRHIDAVLQDWVKKYGSSFRFPDQTLFNLAVRPEDVVRLPLRYDFPAGLSDRVYQMVASYNCAEKPTFSKESVMQKRKNVVILHYIGGKLPTKPWFSDCTIWGREHYLRYRALSRVSDAPMASMKEKKGRVSLFFTRLYDIPFSARISRLLYHIHRLLVRKKPLCERTV